MQLTAGNLVLLGLVLFLLIIQVALITQVIRWVWRFFRENEEPVAGGSLGSQVFGAPSKKTN